MKQLRFLLVALVCACFATIAHADTYNAKIGDTTVTGAAAPAYTLTVGGPKSSVSFEYVIAKTSGTVAGTIVLLGTVDGTNYATINTYTLTDASANTSLTYNYNGYIKYKVIVNQTNATVNANYKIWALYRN